MDWLLHLVHNDHGEWSALMAFLATGPALLWQWALAWLPRARWRVVHQKVTPPFFNPRVEERTYGPYRLRVTAVVVAHLVCGEWDCCDIQERQ